MIKKTVSIDEAVDFLNHLIELDRNAVAGIISNRVRCNRSLAEHESVQVLVDSRANAARVGFLGVLNGLFGVDDEGYGTIMALYDSKGRLVRISRLAEKGGDENDN